MTYLLDSNVIIAILKGKGPDGRHAVSRLVSHPVDEVCVCSVVQAELWHGAEKYGIPERRRANLVTILSPYRSLPFDSACVQHYARIRHFLETSGQTIGGHDLMIASIALTHGLILVTHNSGEFSRVPDLNVEDWCLPI